MSLYLVFDVESIGLHGEGFAVGYIVVNQEGNKFEEGLFACDPSKASGTIEDRRWVSDHVAIKEFNYREPYEVRQEFWRLWKDWKAKGATLVADCPWPVEARFLNQCIDDHGLLGRNNLNWDGPYPLIDVGSVRLGAGLDPISSESRLSDELPEHNPLNDARQSARIFLKALEFIYISNINDKNNNDDSEQQIPETPKDLGISR